MKDFKKILATVMALATLGCVSAIPTDAVIFKDNDNNSQKTLEYYQENSVREAFIVLDYGDDKGMYYFNTYYSQTGEASIDTSTLSEEDINTIKSGYPVKVNDDMDTADLKVITVTENSNSVLIDTPSCYTYFCWDESKTWVELTSKIDKTTLGDSVTVGNSETTGIRGDVNRDGKVTTADLLLLKKYLLGITTYGNDYKFDYVQKHDYRVDRSTFETVCTENGVDIKNVIYNEVEKTATFTFGNGSTLVVPANFSNLILSSKVQNPRKEAVIYTNDEGKTVDMSNECYYVLGYTVSCANVHEFTGNIEDENEYIYDGTHSSQYTKHKPLGDSVALPDGTVLNCEGLRRDVEIVYDLNGKYMGFRVPRSGGEDGMFSDIYIIPSNSNVVIGSSESISVSGDVNDDGKATTIDLLLLKKYLLGITTW